MIRFGPSGNAREFYEQGKKTARRRPSGLLGEGLTLTNTLSGEVSTSATKRQTP